MANDNFKLVSRTVDLAKECFFSGIPFSDELNGLIEEAIPLFETIPESLVLTLIEPFLEMDIIRNDTKYLRKSGLFNVIMKYSLLQYSGLKVK